MPSREFPREVRGSAQVGQAWGCIQVLAAGRKCGSPVEIRAALESAYEDIKCTDFCILGLYLPHPDQVCDDSCMPMGIPA